MAWHSIGVEPEHLAAKIKEAYIPCVGLSVWGPGFGWSLEATRLTFLWCLLLHTSTSEVPVPSLGYIYVSLPVPRGPYVCERGMCCPSGALLPGQDKGSAFPAGGQGLGLPQPGMG